MSTDSGYATVAVTALMSALSLLAASYLHLSVAEAKKSDAIVELLQTDMLLEGALSEIIADLVNKDGEPVPDVITQRIYRGESYEVRLQTEGDKVDVNRADILEIRDAAAKLSWLTETRSELLRRIEARRSGSETLFRSMDELTGESTDPHLYDCLRQVFTPYHSSAVRAQGAGTGAAAFPDGSVVRIEVATLPPGALRLLDVTILITGRRDEPFWVMDWRRRTANLSRECDGNA